MSGYKEINRLKRRVMIGKEFIKRGIDLKYWIYRIKWNLFPKFDIITSFPLHLDIETTDACNLRCVMCVHSYEKNLKTGFIDIDFAKRLIDEGARNRLYSVKFNWRGEPTLHKGLPELVKYAKRKGIIDVQFNTNGLPLNEEKMEKLIDAGLDRIIFSMDGATKETYERIRVGGRFERLVNNIKTLYEIRRKKGRKRPFIRIQMVRMKDNKEEVNSFIKIWRPFVDDIRISDVTDRGQGNRFTVGDQIATGRRPCPQPWQRLVISWDGKVVGCCSDWWRERIVGDATRESIKSIWHGKEMNRIRQIQRELKLDEISPCKKCFVKESYTWKKVTPAERPQTI